MDLSFIHFWDQLMRNPLLVAVLLTLGVILVNATVAQIITKILIFISAMGEMYF